jgi:hypothetical protein
MKRVFSVVAILGFVLGAEAFGADGQVPRSVLAKLGLSGMQPVSDDVGLAVRGRSGNVFTSGRSLVSGLLVTPDTKNFVFASDVNIAIATGELAGVVDPTALHATTSTIGLQLVVFFPDTSVFAGFLVGGAGGFGLASSH